MAARNLYIIAYDITAEKRLNRARYLLKGYSTGGQKSVFECFLTGAELNHVIKEIGYLIDELEDRVHIFQVDRKAKIHLLGIAVEPNDPRYFYFG